jgi:Ca-activated chloride channel family protein
MIKPASSRPRPLARLCRAPIASMLASATLIACAPAPEPLQIGEAIPEPDNRFIRAIHSPDPLPEEEEPPPEDMANSDEEAAGSGQRHRGEEGKMGRPTSRAKSGLYAMKGPRDAIPQMAAGHTRAVRSEVEETCVGCDPAGGDRYGRTDENRWASVIAEPLSTFSIDVDTASYSNVRRFLQSGALPPAAAVRTEELINYFTYAYPQPKDERPLAVDAEVAACPWNPTHKLVRIGMQGKTVPVSQMGPRNLVFLVDVSGSMSDGDKLPLLRHGLNLLVDDMTERDRISMVAYAGASGLVLPPTSGADKKAIREAIANLEAGGSTNGGAGIALAYAQARKHLVKGGVNRVILASDGDFNVGVTDHDELIKLVEQQRSSGVYLSVLGFGRGNLNDHTMEQIADKGNGNYSYIDSEREAKKVLVDQAAGTLMTIAKDVKLQVEWNPSAVAAYRLIGYENRRLAAQDFKDDRKDAGELGAGHSVTGLYEVVPAGVPTPGGKLDALKYQKPAAPAKPGAEMFTVKLRYKLPESAISTGFEMAVATGDRAAPSDAFRLAAAVAAFGERLRDPLRKDGLTFAQIHDLAASVELPDPRGDRKEFLRLVNEAAKMTPPPVTKPPPGPLKDDELG